MGTISGSIDLSIGFGFGFSPFFFTQGCFICETNELSTLSRYARYALIFFSRSAWYALLFSSRSFPNAFLTESL